MTGPLCGNALGCMDYMAVDVCLPFLHKCFIAYTYTCTESDNNVNMVLSEQDVSEAEQVAVVCARVEGVSEIERGFSGNFEIIADDELAGKISWY